MRLSQVVKLLAGSWMPSFRFDQQREHQASRPVNWHFAKSGDGIYYSPIEQWILRHLFCRRALKTDLRHFADTTRDKRDKADL